MRGHVLMHVTQPACLRNEIQDGFFFFFWINFPLLLFIVSPSIPGCFNMYDSQA